MSRNPSRRQGSSPAETIEEDVSKVLRTETDRAINDESAITLDDIREATNSCSLSTRIKEMMRNNPDTVDPEIQPYKRVIDKLSIIDEVICKGNKIVIPPVLQRKAVKLCHRAHQGISKTKAYARTFCWFPGIDHQIEQKVRKCPQCQAVQDADLGQPIKPRELPEGPWQQIEMDFQGPYPTGQYILAAIDRYTRWPEIKIVNRAPNSKMTCDALEDIFKDKGVPEICQSDNGSPFQSQEMLEFSRRHCY